jgi:2-polyprenyl-6-methoxyphenol hydroxylase-like FAD-dependent oxidoreductase
MEDVHRGGWPQRPVAGSGTHPRGRQSLPSVLLDGFVIAADRSGVTLAMGAMDPREAPEAAATRLAPDVRMDPVIPYMMLSGGVAPGTTIPTPGQWGPDTAAEVHAAMVDAVADWHSALRGLVERIELSTLFSTHFKRLDPTPAWESSQVTVMGDAIHAMLPTFGMGGNTSLRDASLLTDALAAANRGERSVIAAIAAYEEQMREYVYPIMEMSADHDRFGGGGLRREPV